MNIEKLKENKAKEIKKLEILNEKKSDIDEKIKNAEAQIKKIDVLLNQEKMEEASITLSATGITFDELLEAIKKGDLLTLQEKIEKN